MVTCKIYTKPAPKQEVMSCVLLLGSVVGSNKLPGADCYVFISLVSFCGSESNTEYTGTLPLTDPLSVARMEGLNDVNWGKPNYSTTVPTWTALGPNPDLCCEKLASNHVIYGMSQFCEWFTANILVKYLNHHGYTICSCNILWLLWFPYVLMYLDIYIYIYIYIWR